MIVAGVHLDLFVCDWDDAGKSDEQNGQLGQITIETNTGNFLIVIIRVPVSSNFFLRFVGIGCGREIKIKTLGFLLGLGFWVGIL